MSQWNDRIRNHAVWATLKSLGPAIDQAAERKGIDAGAVDSLERLRAVLSFCGKRLAAADPFLSDPRPLDRIHGFLNSAVAEVQAYVSDGNVGHLATANTHADEILSNLSAILAPTSDDDLTVIGESISAYRAALEKHLAEALASVQALKAKAEANSVSLTALDADIVSEKQQVATIAAGFQTQFTADQAARAAEYTAAQTARQTDYTAKATEYQTSFSAAQTERQEKYAAIAAENQAQFTAAQQARVKEHADAHQDRQDRTAALLADYTKKLDEQTALFAEARDKAEKRTEEQLTALKIEYEQSTKNILEAMIARKEEVEKLVGVIGNLGVTSGYLKVANHARGAMYVWQSLTVLSLGTLIVFAYLIAFTPHMPDVDFLQGLATRVFLSITIGLLAAYAANQGNKALISERKNRKLALELEALGPYIAPLPQEMQNKFRAELGERSFGVPDGEGQKVADNTPSPVTVLDLLKSKEGRELIADLVKVVQVAKP